MNNIHDIDSITHALSYSSKFCGSTILIKLGGSILHDDFLIHNLCEDLKLLQGIGMKVVLVHGGGKAINEALKMNHIPSNFIDGLRVTTKEAMKVVEMVLCGYVNQALVRKLNGIGINAIGLSGSDGGMLKCTYYSEKHGFVGAIKSVNIDPIMNVLSSQDARFGSIPVIAPIGVDEQGNTVNINADLAACQIAGVLCVDKLIYLTDQDGIYDEQGQRYSELGEIHLEALVANKVVTGGMLIKVKAILSSLKSGLNHIHILNGNSPNVLIKELFTVSGVGTVCKTDFSMNEPLEVMA